MLLALDASNNLQTRKKEEKEKEKEKRRKKKNDRLKKYDVVEVLRRLLFVATVARVDVSGLSA